MKIKIETLSNAPGKTFTYDFTVAEAALSLNEEDMQVTAPLEVQMRAAYRDEKVEVEGSLRTRVILTCSRCLKRFLFSVNEEFADEMPMENEAEIDLSLLAEKYLLPCCLTNLFVRQHAKVSARLAVRISMKNSVVVQ